MVVVLMALGLVAAVGYPLWKGVKEDALSAVTAELVVQDGVAYADQDELALDRALGRVSEESEAVAVADVDVEEKLERRVAALRRQRRAVPTAAGSCPQCGHTYDAGDRFCAHCGASLVQTCPKCGHTYDAGDLFCFKCGQEL
jgi:hypothetical protein